MKSENSYGVLYIVATPIGNLEDITLRALRILKEVDFIAAEDTRRTRKLLSYYDLHIPLLSYHKYSKQKRGQQIITLLKEGKNIALVTDAGTPCISDPGYRILNEAIDESISIEAIPGASALTGALSICGLSIDRFVFEGFLDARKKRRQDKLLLLQEEERSLVFFESPHRILACLQDIESILGPRKICLVRELTKKFEEILRGEISSIIKSLQDRPSIKGEFILIIGRKGK